MTIEKLTENDRGWLKLTAYGTRAERIIDAHEAESAALRAELAAARERNEQREHAWSVDVAHRHTAEAQLAEARALLAVNMPMASADEAEDWTEAVQAWLTANPVSPRAAAERAVPEECNCPRNNMYDSSRTGWREDCPKHGSAPRVVKP